MYRSGTLLTNYSVPVLWLLLIQLIHGTVGALYHYCLYIPSLLWLSLRSLASIASSFFVVRRRSRFPLPSSGAVGAYSSRGNVAGGGEAGFWVEGVGAGAAGGGGS